MLSATEVTREFRQKLDLIVRNHNLGCGGIRTALALTERLDNLVRKVFRNLDADRLSIVALGGYGRRELCFYSDVDVMILVRNDKEQSAAKSATEQFLHALLDIGLDIGHSFRTIQECLEFSDGELETWLSLLEARFICGNRSTYREFNASISARLRRSDKAAFVEKIAELTATRHQKYGDSTTLLEPNIKNSAGGLRDLHTLLWLMRGLGKERLNSPAGQPALVSLLRSKQQRDRVGSEVARKSIAAFDVLLRTRNEMHLKSQSHHDTLEFSYQPIVAAGLQYRPTRLRNNVERFMQDYYIAARTASQVAQRSIVWAKDSVSGKSPRVHPQILDETFTIVNNRLHLRHHRAPLSNESVLRAFVLSNEHRVDFSFVLEDRIHNRRAALTPLRSRHETDLFRRLLNQGEGLGKCLHEMNDLGILERWIPEWKPMVAFFQHNMYHYYTADEHTLKVVDNAESLSRASSLFGEVFRSLVRKDILFLACLFHDIAKPQRIGDHEIVGVGVAAKILARLRYTDAESTVGFLIRHHLLMEQVAFRRNLNDPQTAVDFASRFENVDQLNFLFILTYADLSAVNKNVWTQWKEMLLTDLYRKAHDVLTRRQTSEEVRMLAQQERQRQLALLLPALTREVAVDIAQSHLDGVESPEYLTVFDASEISGHLRTIASNEPTSTLFKHLADFTEVTLIARDAPYALSHCCAVLTANDANIFDAHIFTRNDGIIIDKFRVVNLITSSVLSEQQTLGIQSDMRDVFTGQLDVRHLLERHRLKWKRRTQSLNPNIRFDVEFEDHPRFTIIDVFAADKIGFLHRITETISNLGLDISFAKIATRVDGIVDSFYVLDRFGKRINDVRQKELIKDEIMQTMKEFFELELSGTGSA
ncbi:MAG TPA: [protein-PII] uridylyltransferase [Bacteroidota bacterium]